MSAASEREGLRLAVQEGLIAAWDDATEYADAPRVVADAVFAALSGLGYVRIDPDDDALVKKVAWAMQADDVAHGYYAAEWGDYPQTDAAYLRNAATAIKAVTQ